MYKYTTFALQLEHIILKNTNGFQAELLNYGATLWKLWAPDDKGVPVNVILGLKDAQDFTSQYYKEINFCMGATIGRYAGRISNGGFNIQDTFYPLQSDITLHGGSNGFDKQYWQVVSKSESKVVFHLKDKEGSHGFPGILKIFATYELLDNGLRILYEATSNSETVINMTNHAYFNLNGKDTVLDHQLQMNATHLCETTNELIPTGKLIPISETGNDYRIPTSLDFLPQIPLDTPFLVTKDETPKASLWSPISGIEMLVHSNQPAMVLFTPKTLEKLSLADTYANFPAICFECQNLPDAPNQPHFPDSSLFPKQKYSNEIKITFGIR